jgi:hypothetical protein
VRVICREKYFDPKAGLAAPIVQEINYSELAARVIGIVDAAERGQKMELQALVVTQKLETIKDLCAIRFQRQRPVEGEFYIFDELRRFLFNVRLQRVVVEFHNTAIVRPQGALVYLILFH